MKFWSMGSGVRGGEPLNKGLQQTVRQASIGAGLVSLQIVARSLSRQEEAKP